MRFYRDPETLWPTSLVDWLVVLMLVGLLAALLVPAVVWST
jgi:competence protein ComGC